VTLYDHVAVNLDESIEGNEIQIGPLSIVRVNLVAFSHSVPLSSYPQVFDDSIITLASVASTVVIEVTPPSALPIPAGSADAKATDGKSPATTPDPASSIDIDQLRDTKETEVVIKTEPNETTNDRKRENAQRSTPSKKSR